MVFDLGGTDLPEKAEKKPEQIRLPDRILQYAGHTIKQYKLDDDETFYTWEKPDMSIEGVLRYENVGMRKTSDKLETIFHRLREKEKMLGLPSSNEEISHLLFKTTYRQEENFEHPGNTKVQIQYKLDFNKPPLNKYKGHFWKRTLAAMAALAIPMGGMFGALIYASMDTDVAPYFTYMMTAVSGVAGGSVGCLAGMMASVTHQEWMQNKMTKTSQILEEAIRNEQKIKKLTKESDTTHQLTARQIRKKENLRKKQDKLFQYLTESFKLKCVSISSKEYNTMSPDRQWENPRDVEKKLINYFNELRSEITHKEAEWILRARPKEKYDAVVNKVVEGFKEKDKKQFHKDLAAGKYSPKEKIPEPATKTLDEITLTKDWKKDEKYGELIDGRYELKEKIGEGALGRLYRARDIRNDNEVVVKFEKAELGKDTIQKRKDLHLKLMRLEKHDSVIPELDANLYCTPAYIVNEFIRGADLKKILDSIRELNEEKDDEYFLSMENIVSISKELARALVFLHENGIAHYDVKPENMIVDQEGRPHLGDCDLGSVQKEKMASMIASMASVDNGKQIGTPNYMSPQMRGIEPGPVDERADIYSLGVTLGELISNEAIPRVGILEKRSDMTDEFKRIIAKCQEPKLKRRYQTMQEVLGDLNKLSINSKPLKLRIMDAEPVEKEEQIIQEAIKEEPHVEIPTEQAVQEIPKEEPVMQAQETQEEPEEEPVEVDTDSNDGRLLEGFA